MTDQELIDEIPSHLPEEEDDCCGCQCACQPFFSGIHHAWEITKEATTFLLCLGAVILGIWVAATTIGTLAGYGTHLQFTKRVSLNILSSDDLARQEAEKKLLTIHIADPTNGWDNKVYLRPEDANQLLIRALDSKGEAHDMTYVGSSVMKPMTVTFASDPKELAH